MNIKFMDFVRLVESTSSRAELELKCNIIYGMDSNRIICEFCQLFQVSISDVIRNDIDLKSLADYLEYLGKKYEEKNTFYIQKSSTYENNLYTRYIVEYYLPDCFKLENLSINI